MEGTYFWLGADATHEGALAFVWLCKGEGEKREEDVEKLHADRLKLVVIGGIEEGW